MIFFILIWSLCSLAFIALASSMSKHQKQIFGRELSSKQTLVATIVGWSVFGISLTFCLMAGNISNMLSYWIGVLTCSALLVGLCLSYFDAQIKYIFSFSILIAFCSGVLYLI